MFFVVPSLSHIFSIVRPLLHCTIVDVVFHTNNNIIIEVVTDNYTKTNIKILPCPCPTLEQPLSSSTEYP